MDMEGVGQDSVSSMSKGAKTIKAAFDQFLTLPVTPGEKSSYEDCSEKFKQVADASRMVITQKFASVMGRLEGAAENAANSLLSCVAIYVLMLWERFQVREA